MSTRSHIGIVNKNGTVEAIYCHFDGYPEHHVPILTRSYVTEEAVRALVVLGDLSTLADSIGAKHDFERCPAGQCNAYGRDRGEQNTAAKMYPSEEAFLERAREDYTYLFRDGAWFGRSWGHTLRPVADLLREHQEEDDA